MKDLRNLDALETSEQAALVVTLRKLSQMTWQQINQCGKYKGGYEKITVKQLRGVLLPGDVGDFVLAFRFDGMKPMLGVREDATLRIFHLDRDFSAYDHE